MKRTVVTLLAVFSLFAGVAGTAANVSEANSGRARIDCSGSRPTQDRDCENKNNDKDKIKDRCDDERSRRHSPPACNRDGSNDSRDGDQSRDGDDSRDSSKGD